MNVYDERDALRAENERLAGELSAAEARIEELEPVIVTHPACSTCGHGQNEHYLDNERGTTYMAKGERADSSHCEGCVEEKPETMYHRFARASR